ncbi:MAG: hypothetical protein IAB19_10445 [Proteobacteria bacterium]|uniref:Catalase n=1 Tax=Candidatus Avisuccinivibrio stercorigallinarum TaxID=2840704 RepID=A0A9D9DCZ7_9GAMM|nr:hypothetical protein [Candidatus Avisuccinivibrio stercorigallinarum]
MQFLALSSLYHSLMPQSLQDAAGQTAGQNTATAVQTATAPVLPGAVTAAQNTQQQSESSYSSNQSERGAQSCEAQQTATFAHNRHQALKAYLSFGKTGNADSTAPSSAAAALPEGMRVSIPGTETDAVTGAEAEETGSNKVPAEPELPGSKPAVAGTGSDAHQDEENDVRKVQGEEKRSSDGDSLTEEEQEKVDQMQARHDEVKTHEQAHKSAGGSLAAAPSYTYETGPDGKRYITDGEVQIDTAEEDDPRDTITKMQQVKRAALAPAEPSSQDRKVASEASRIEAQARAELLDENSTLGAASGGAASGTTEDSGAVEDAVKPSEAGDTGQQELSHSAQQ